MKTTSEAAFETAIESVLLAGGYARVAAQGFDRERALIPDLLDHRRTQWRGQNHLRAGIPAAGGGLQALHQR